MGSSTHPANLPRCPQARFHRPLDPAAEGRVVAGEVDAAFSSLGVLRTFGSAIRAPYGALIRRPQRHPRMRGTGGTATGKAAVVLQAE